MALVLSACALPPIPTPTPPPSPSPTSTPAPTRTPTPVASASPTPNLAAIPDFSAGDLVATRIDGLRVRGRPGAGGVVVTGLLPFAAELQVVMGPIVVEDLGWYLVTDADEAEPQFEEGWIASGFEPEAWLVRTDEAPADSPYVASLAGSGDAEQGPIAIGDGDHAIRWVASDASGAGCRLAVSFAAGGDDPVPAIRSTVGGGDLVPGTLQPAAFDALGVRGQAFVTVASDCRWALVIQRVPEATPTPSAGDG